MAQVITAILERISGLRTPLMLGGISVLVLYAVYTMVLELPIFASLGEKSTFLIINRIIAYVFWLALTATVLGFLGYIVAKFLRRKANVELVESIVLPQDENSNQGGEGGHGPRTD